MSRRSTTLRAGTSRISVRPARTSAVVATPRLVAPAARQVSTIRDAFQSMTDEKDIRLLTDAQIDELLAMTYSDDSQRLIINPNRNRSQKDLAIIYSIMGLIVKSGFDQTIAYLNSVDTSTDIPFEVPTLRFAVERRAAEIRALRDEIVVKSGIYPCRKCGSKNTMDVQRQTRSGDEPLTTFVTCLEKSCRYHFKITATTAQQV